MRKAADLLDFERTVKLPPEVALQMRNAADALQKLKPGDTLDFERTVKLPPEVALKMQNAADALRTPKAGDALRTTRNVVEQSLMAASTASADPPDEVAVPCPSKPDFKVSAHSEKGMDLLYVEADGDTRHTKTMARASGSAKAGAVQMDDAGHLAGVLGGSHKIDQFYAQAKGEIGASDGLGAAFEAKAATSSQEGTLFVGSDENNPWAEAGGAYDLMAAEAKGELLIGSDGRRAGVALGGKLGAAAATGDLKGEINIPIPFTSWTLSLRGKGGLSAGSLGVGAGAYGYKDLDGERYHAGIWGEVAALLGVKADVDLSAGPAYDSRKR